MQSGIAQQVLSPHVLAVVLVWQYDYRDVGHLAVGLWVVTAVCIKKLCHNNRQ